MSNYAWRCLEDERTSLTSEVNMTVGTDYFRVIFLLVRFGVILIIVVTAAFTENVVAYAVGFV